MSLMMPLRNERRRLSNRVSLVLGLSTKSITPPASLAEISKLWLIFETSPDNSNAGVWVRRWSRVLMVTCSRSGSHSETFLPSETISCSCGASVCQLNRPGRCKVISPLVSCNWVPLPSSVSCEKLALRVLDVSSNWVKRCTSLSSAWAGMTEKASADTNNMRIRRMGVLIEFSGVQRAHCYAVRGCHALSSVAHRARRDHLTRAIGVHGRHDARHFHRFDHASGAVVADLEFALHRRDGRATAFEHEFHCFVIQCIAFAVFAAFTAAAIEATAGLFDARQDVFVVIRCAPQLPGLHDAVNFIVGHKCAVDPDRQAGTRWHVQHVTVAEQLFGASLVDDGP